MRWNGNSWTCCMFRRVAQWKTVNLTAGYSKFASGRKSISAWKQSILYRIVQYPVTSDYIILIWKLLQFILWLSPPHWHEHIKAEWRCLRCNTLIKYKRWNSEQWTQLPGYRISALRLPLTQHHRVTVIAWASHLAACEIFKGRTILKKRLIVIVILFVIQNKYFFTLMEKHKDENTVNYSPYNKS